MQSCHSSVLSKVGDTKAVLLFTTKVYFPREIKKMSFCEIFLRAVVLCLFFIVGTFLSHMRWHSIWIWSRPYMISRIYFSKWLPLHKVDKRSTLNWFVTDIFGNTLYGWPPWLIFYGRWNYPYKINCSLRIFWNIYAHVYSWKLLVKSSQNQVIIFCCNQIFLDFYFSHCIFIE